ncbi:MAG: carboxypeptidase regulatory-like domain-containing protein [Bryobacteraceae bacterium]
MTTARILVRLLVCGALMAAAVSAQEFRGSITGRVIDPQQALVPGARIAAIQMETMAKAETVSTSDGQYTLPFLPPGTYRVTAEFQGFKKFAREGLRVSSNERISVDITMEVGATTDSVTVTAESPLLVTATASTGQVINERQIQNMPINGRTPLLLSQLSMGVIPTNNPQFIRPFDDGGPSTFSMGGAPAKNNELLLDGSPDFSVGNGLAYSPPVDSVEEVKVELFQADAAYGHSAGGTVNVVTKGGTNAFHGTAYEFNQVSALGATLFFTNSAGKKKSVSNYNQWGLTSGGPVYIPKIADGRNKLFFFFAYEGIKQNMPQSSFTTVPTEAERNGDLSALLKLGNAYQIYDPYSGVREGSRVRRQPFANNVIPQARISPVAKAILPYYGLPNQPGNVDGRNNYFVGNPAELNNFNNEMGRLDYNASARHKIMFNMRYNERMSDQLKTFDNNATGVYLNTINWGATVDNVYTLTPTTVLDVRMNWLRNADYRGGYTHGFDFTTLGFPSHLLKEADSVVFPRMRVDSFQTLGTDNGGGVFQPYDSFQLFAGVNKTAGRHSFKFGADTRMIRQNKVNYNHSTGEYVFSTNWTRGPLDNAPGSSIGQDWAAFLLGLPTSGSWDHNAAEASQNVYLSFYLQDDFRVKSNLTLNLGLRVEQELPTTERFNRSTNGFDFTTPSPISAAAAAAYAKNPIPELAVSQFKTLGGLLFASERNRRLFTTPSAAWGPRFGFSWTPGALGGKTVFRGGMGMMYSPLNRQGTGIDQTGFSARTPLVASLDSWLTPNATLSNPFPGGILKQRGSADGLATYLGNSVGYFSPSVRNAYSLRFNFDIQRELPGNMVLEVGYVHNHSLHMGVDRQRNAVPAQFLSTSPVRDAAVINRNTASVANPFAGLIGSTSLDGSTVSRTQLLRPYPHFTGLTERTAPVGSSYFDSLQVRVEKRFSHGIQFLANYQFSKLIEQRTFLNDTDLRPEKRVAGDDRPQRLVASVNWELPFGRGRAIGSDINRVWNRFVSGWTVNSIYTIQPGPPLSWGNVIYYGGDLNLNPRRLANAFDTTRFNRVSAEQLSQNLRTFPTYFGNLRRDGVNSMDFSAVKNNAITERINLQLRCEFFNFLNHPNFSAPNLSPTNSNFGRITGQANLARSTQLALRLVW